jgi:hypothetical protein
MENGFKYYSGRIPACGVFCGGCPIYIREKNPCPGADINFQRCERCMTFHLCCKDRNITHCYECAIFPCAKFKGFAKRWLKYGQDFIENQKLLKAIGEVKFLEYYNTQINEKTERIDAESIALQFNDYINNQNLNGLVNLMTGNHVFIDSANNRITGKSNNEANWRKFFELFPGYRNIFEAVRSTDLAVIMRGYSVCPDDRLNNSRAIWVARIVGGKVDEWHVYFDTEENRKFLKIEISKDKTMDNYTRKYPLLSLCGLNCGLCPAHEYHSNGKFQCPGCGGKDFFQKHPACAIMTCSQKHGGIEYCYLCEEYPCKKYDGAEAFDSFITHRNQLKNFEKIKKTGLEAYKSELTEKVEILRFLLSKYNDGRRKNFFCIAVNLLELQDIKYVMEQIAEETKPDGSIKENSAIAVRLFQDMAEKRNIVLKLRKK